MVWVALLNKYEPNNGQAMVDLKLEFNASTLSSAEEDPDVWIANLLKLKSRLNAMNVTLTDNDLLLHILCNLPKEYETIIKISTQELKANKLKVEDLRATLNARFQRLQGPRDNDYEKAFQVNNHSVWNVVIVVFADTNLRIVSICQKIKLNLMNILLKG